MDIAQKVQRVEELWPAVEVCLDELEHLLEEIDISEGVSMGKNSVKVLIKQKPYHQVCKIPKHRRVIATLLT